MLLAHGNAWPGLGSSSLLAHPARGLILTRWPLRALQRVEAPHCLTW
ncbi:hypothetical protein [Pseudonocardia spinosispora]|nr:hypothetical protein [Pseudonocardia spinosispora]